MTENAVTRDHDASPAPVGDEVLDGLRARLRATRKVPLPTGFGWSRGTDAERFFDVRAWDEQPTGGHFAAWERPEAYAAGLRAAVALA